jgi:hypothetical protein
MIASNRNETTPGVAQQLWRSAVRVLARNRRLLVFPVLGLLAAFLGVAGVLQLADWIHGVEGSQSTPQTLLASGVDLFGHRRLAPTLAGYAGIALGYLWWFTCWTFCNVAFFHELVRAFSGQSVSPARGLRFAWSRLNAVLAWSLLGALVGMILRVFVRRFGLISAGVGQFLGDAWDVGFVFAIPVMLREPGDSPWQLLRCSGVLIRKTWGEFVLEFVGIRLRYGLLLAAGPVLVLLVCAVWLPSMVLLWLIVATGLLVIGAVRILSDVYVGALYVYATEGVVPEPFDSDDMDAAWRMK